MSAAAMHGSTADSPGGGNGTAAATDSPRPSRYESQKRRDWHTFGQYLRNHRPPLELARCSGAHVLEFLRYLDQFGKTKVHGTGCPFFGHPSPPAPCPCPLKQAWGSLDALVGRLRAAFEEHGGRPEANPFGARAVRLYLREVRDSQAKARGIAYEKKRRKRPLPQPAPPKAASPVPAAPAERTDIGADLNAVVGEHHHHHHHHPHAHFLHGHFLMPEGGVTVGGGGGSNDNGSASGDDMVMAMAAAAEAHAAGCLLPLSVFN